jgi:hypothetical protein
LVESHVLPAKKRQQIPSKGGTVMADDNTNAQAHQQPPEPSSALEHLNALVGEWTM